MIKTIVCQECDEEAEVSYSDDAELEAAVRDLGWQQQELQDNSIVYLCDECSQPEEDC